MLLENTVNILCESLFIVSQKQYNKSVLLLFEMKKKKKNFFLRTVCRKYKFSQNRFSLES